LPQVRERSVVGPSLAEERDHQVWRAAALEQHDRVEQLDVEVARNHERVAGRAAMPCEALEPSAEKFFDFGRFKHLELCRSHLYLSPS
jgi:hypothetical protein